MCGRFAAGHLTQAEMRAIMDHHLHGVPLVFTSPDISALGGYNIKPTNDVSICCMESEALVQYPARWWFVPHWFQGATKDWKATTFNARIEEAAQKPSFRTAWNSGRCVIPAVAWYEWSGPKSNRVPWALAPVSNLAGFVFAGLYAQRPDGQFTTTILTQAASKQIDQIHHRMPVVLMASQAQEWLTGACGEFGWGGDFHAWRINRFGRDDDGDALLEPL